MSRTERRKGLRGEHEVAALLRLHGFTVRGLEGSGDHLAIGHGLTIHVECKRQEVARPWLWGEQALREAPAGTLPLVAMRRSRCPWYALVPLDELLGAIGNAATAEPPAEPADLVAAVERIRANALAWHDPADDGPRRALLAIGNWCDEALAEATGGPS